MYTFILPFNPVKATALCPEPGPYKECFVFGMKKYLTKR